MGLIFQKIDFIANYLENCCYLVGLNNNKLQIT